MKTKMLSIVLATIMIFSIFMVTIPTYAQTIEDGIAWLASQQRPDGSWGDFADFLVGETGFAVLKFETHAIQHNIDPFDPDYEYSDEIRLGLDYIFNNAHTMPIAVQPYGDPDTDGDGIGVYFVSPSGWERSYETGIAMMAIASSTHPGAVVNVPGSPVNGWKYRHVVQDAVDYFAFGQNDGGWERGGWGYTDNNVGWSDNSNTGFAVLGLAYAEASPPGGFELTIPEFVKNELDVWIEYIQDDVSGGSGYTSPTTWVNTLKTGNLLFEMRFVGDTVDRPRVRAAIDYLVTYWNAPYRMGWGTLHSGWRNDLGIDDDLDGLVDEDPWDGIDNDFDGLVDEDQGNIASYYQAMYCIMKGLEAFGIEEIDGIDWQADFEEVLIDEQNPDGSWPSSPLSEVHGWSDLILSTEWALLTLEKAVPPPPPPGIPEVKEELEAIEAKLDKWLPEIKIEVMNIELKLDKWLPEIKREIVMIEEKLDLWLPEIKTEIMKIEGKLDFWLPLIKEEIEAIEWKLDYTIDKEAVEVEILTGKDVGVGTQILKNRFVYYMMTTVAGQKTSMDKIEIEAEATMLDPSTYTVTELKPGVYMIEIDRKAVAEGTRFFVIQVEKYMPCFVVYHGAAFAPAFNVG